MLKRKRKHTAYYEVRDAFQEKEACPFCILELRSVERYLTNILYENVNNPSVRKELKLARGYCHRHAHKLLEYGDGLGTATIYADQVEAFWNTLQHCRKKHRNQLDWHPSKPCPACVIQEESRHRYMETFLEWLDDQEMRETVENGGMLCIPHLKMIIDQCHSPAQREILLSLHEKKYKSLLEEIHEFIRKHDYRFAHEPYGTEANSWRRAIHMISGEKGVF